MSLKAVISGVGSYLPEKILTNDELATMVDTSDEWIRERTGIRERRIAAEGQFTSDLAVEASKVALADAGLSADDIDLVVVATTSPDKSFPATAAIVQGKLGIKQGAAFDLQAVCSGFIYALSTVEKFLTSGQHKRALVIGAETFTRLLDWEDRSTCVLFGDGAGAFVLEALDEAEAGDRGMMGAYLRCDGSMVDMLHTDGGVSTTKTAGTVQMQGNKVFRAAVNRISEAIEMAAGQAHVDVHDIDWLVPHQANERIIEGVVRKLDLRVEQVVSTIATHGNTSAASIPLAYCVGVEDGRIKKGDLVLIEGMGGGLTWGAALFRA